MNLVLEIEYLSGVSFAAISPDSTAPDWPPQPDRVFSALVATWAARGQRAGEAEALEWLEALSPPRILEQGAEPRTSVTVFVPPNDSRSDKQKGARGVLPALRSRQPRFFPAARPTDPLVRLVWLDAQPVEKVLDALKLLAHDTAYVGHAASLTRCRFVLQDGKVDTINARSAARQVYRGRLRELQEDYAWYERTGDRRGGHPLAGLPAMRNHERALVRASVFGDHWLVLEHLDDLAGDMPDQRACALVAKAIRDTILSGYQRIGLGGQIPEVVSGHASGGAPSTSPHMAIVPLCFAGFPHADGHVVGFALVPPRGSELLGDDDFRRAMRNIAPLNEALGRRVLTVTSKEGTARGQAFSIKLSPTLEPGKRSLDPRLYVGRGRVFATVTPIVLNRHLRERGDARHQEIEAHITAACGHVGLPIPDAVVAHKHATFEGVASAYPSGNAPSWMRWRLPPSLASRQLTHAVIRFAEPMEGPLLLGAGRYAGLGLCRPLDASND